MLAETQERLLDAYLAPLDGAHVLDVGTGTGRAAIALARRHARVTGVDASAEMLSVARQRAVAAAVEVTFEQGDAHALPFADGSFDAAIALRVLMHTPDWQQCLAELCRVSRNRIVFDYPSARSFAALQAAARRTAAALGRPVEAYRVFSPGHVQAAVEKCGYRIAGVHRQFVLPIAVHKALNWRAATEATERVLAAVGLSRAFGSPITVVAERCAS